MGGESSGGNKAAAEWGLEELRRRKRLQAADEALEELRRVGYVPEEETAERARKRMEEGGDSQ